MTLKQSQGHQTLHESVDLEQGYNHADLGRPFLRNVREKALTLILGGGRIRKPSIISLEYM